jgi:putative transposase
MNKEVQMPRHARIAVAGIPWHIIQRGNNRTACFYTEADHHFYLRTLEEQSQECHCDVHAYVLMTNHVHLLITPRERDSTATLMKHLGQRYAQYVNRTYQRTGTLWEGRFRSCLAQHSGYLLTCQRYIELNPVRANMVADPAGYPWSSYRSNALGEPNPVLTPHPDYIALGACDSDRRRQYRRLFDSRLDEQAVAEIRAATNGNYVLGSQRFQEQIEKAVGRRVTPGKPGRPRRPAKR